MRNALAEARARHPDKIRPAGTKGEWLDLARLLSLPGSKITPQQIWNWRRRKLPTSALVLMADRIPCSIESLRGRSAVAELPKGGKLGEADLTAEEAILIAHYRRLDEGKRDAIFRLATDQPRPAPQTPAPDKKHVVPLHRTRAR